MQTEQQVPAVGGMKRIALGDLDHEIATTRRVIERITDEKLTWRPHPKSMSLGGVASHLANLLGWMRSIAEKDDYELAGVGRQPEPESREQILRQFDTNEAALRDALERLDDAALGRMWTLRNGGQVVLSLPRAAALRTMGISHIVHHRGQLSVFLRLLDIPVPPIYGPSADEA